MGKKVWVPVVSGPLAPYAVGFGSWLRLRAYSPSAAAGRLCQLDQVSRWLEREGLGAGELTDEQAGRFAAARRAAGRVRWASPQSMVLLLGYLRGLGVVPVTAPVIAEGPLEELLADYRRVGYSFDRTCPAQRFALGASNLADLNPTTSSDDVQLPKLVR
jgi:hypothetical protein